jgi:hypothetical protein
MVQSSGLLQACILKRIADGSGLLRGLKGSIGCCAEEGENGGSTLGMLSGTWRLVYSSGFASGSLGGQRPGPPAALVPVTIGQVRPISLAGFRYATPNLMVAILL